MGNLTDLIAFSATIKGIYRCSFNNLFFFFNLFIMVIGRGYIFIYNERFGGQKQPSLSLNYFSAVCQVQKRLELLSQIQDRRRGPQLGHHRIGAPSMLYLHLVVQSHHTDGSTTPNSHTGCRGPVSTVPLNISQALILETAYKSGQAESPACGGGSFLDMVEGNLKQQGLLTVPFSRCMAS